MKNVVLSVFVVLLVQNAIAHESEVIAANAVKVACEKDTPIDHTSATFENSSIELVYVGLNYIVYDRENGKYQKGKMIPNMDLMKITFWNYGVLDISTYELKTDQGVLKVKDVVNENGPLSLEERLILCE